MNPENNETRHALHARSRESNAVVAEPKVAHASDILRDALKGPHETSTPEAEPAAIIADYWHAAKKRYQRGDFPDYGSPDWCALPLDDPRKQAGLVAFAQMWLRYGDEIAADLNQTLRAPHELVHRATTEACEAAFRSLTNQRRKEAA